MIMTTSGECYHSSRLNIPGLASAQQLDMQFYPALFGKLDERKQQGKLLVPVAAAGCTAGVLTIGSSCCSAAALLPAVAPVPAGPLAPCGFRISALGVTAVTCAITLHAWLQHSLPRMAGDERLHEEATPTSVYNCCLAANLRKR
jgi:hypothetical protein